MKTHELDINARIRDVPPMTVEGQVVYAEGLGQSGGGIDPVSIITGAAGLVTNLISNIGKNTPGTIDRKLAAGILAARSLGYTDAQIRMDPIRSLVDQIGSYPNSISNVVNGPVQLFQKLAAQNGVQLPAPQGQPSRYAGTPEGGPPVAGIIGAIYGPEIEALSRSRQPITFLPGPVTPQMLQQAQASLLPVVGEGSMKWILVGLVAVAGVGTVVYLATKK